MDLNRLAARIVKESTDPDENASAKDPSAAERGRKGGLKGGKARAERMTPEQRRESAKHAAAARWDRPA